MIDFLKLYLEYLPTSLRSMMAVLEMLSPVALAMMGLEGAATGVR